MSRIPALGGTLLIIISTLVYLMCPETIDFQKDSSSISEVHLTSLATDEATQTSTRNQTITGRTRHSLIKLKQASAFLLDDWRVPALILPFILHMLVGTIGALLLQYLSKRYGLTFSDATLLMTIRSGVIVLLLFVILPYLSTMIMQKFQLSGPRKDLYLVRVSLVFIVVGWMLVGFSPNIPVVAISLAISALGQGFPLLLRSFLTSLVPAHHIARVYSIVSIVDTAGMMVGSPLLAGLFKRGLALGGVWIGLPFYFTALVGVMFLLLLLVIRLQKCEEGYVSVGEEP
jgi:MFS family permease